MNKLTKMIQKFLKIKRLEKCVKNGFGVFLELECFWSNIEECQEIKEIKALNVDVMMN